MTTVGAVIPASGIGRRMGGVDKVFLPLAGEPVIARTVEAFQTCDEIGQIVLVLNPGSLERGRALVQERSWSKVWEVCAGGGRRRDSVWAGLQRLRGCDWVAVHDGARPLVTGDLIRRGLVAALEVGAAVAAVPVKDTVKVADARGMVEGTPERSRLWAVQTPQVFRYDLICRAYQQVAEDVTDDSALVERLGHPVKLFMGSYDNIKITTPEDVAVAEALLRARSDTHRRGAESAE